MPPKYSLTMCMILAGLCYGEGGDIPLTRAGIASLKGKDICALQGEFPQGIGVYLDHRKEHALDYRVRDGVFSVFLLSRPSTGNCGVVDAVLDLTPLVRTGEKLEFKCSADHEGGTRWGKWGHVIGLANNHGGTKRWVNARLAWRVNVKQKQFGKLHNKLG